MTTLEIGTQLVNLVREGKYEEAMTTLYHPEIVSVEAMEGETQTVTGIDACAKKGEMWSQTMEVHGSTIEGPFPNGDEFAVYFDYDATDRESGSRFHMKEVGVYKVADGKVAHEKFYYHMG